MVNLSKKFQGCFWGAFFGAMSNALNFSPFFPPRVCPVSSGLVLGPQAELWLLRGAPNLRVAFNKIMTKIQGREAPPLELELAHNQPRIPRLKKGKKFGASSVAPKSPSVEDSAIPRTWVCPS